MAFKVPTPSTFITGLGAAALLAVGAGGVAAYTDAPASILTANGDLLTRAAGVPAPLAIGASATLLRSTGSAPAWVTGTTALDDFASTRGYLLRRGASSWAGFAASTADTFVGGDGTDVGLRTAAQVLASIDAARLTSWDFSSSTGWTLVNGSGGATIGSGLLTFTTALGVSTAAPNAPSATVALPSGVDPWRGLDVSARIATYATAGGALPTGSAVAWLSITSKSDAKNGTYSGSDMSVVATVQPDGVVNTSDFTPSVTTRGSSAAGVVQRDGNDWLRIIFRDSAYSILAGRGSTRPTSWTRLYSGTLGAAATSTAAFAQPINITLAGYRNSTTAEAIVIAWDDLAVTRLP